VLERESLEPSAYKEECQVADNTECERLCGNKHKGSIVGKLG
jgi:hypothetical protein